MALGRHGAHGLPRVLALRRAVDGKGMSPSLCHPQWKFRAPVFGPALAHSSNLLLRTHDTWSTCMLLRHRPTHTLLEKENWAQEMETLGPDSHLPTLRKSPKQPLQRGLPTHPPRCPRGLVTGVPMEDTATRTLQGASPPLSTAVRAPGALELGTANGIWTGWES